MNEDWISDFSQKKQVTKKNTALHPTAEQQAHGLVSGRNVGRNINGIGVQFKSLDVLSARPSADRLHVRYDFSG